MNKLLLILFIITNIYASNGLLNTVKHRAYKNVIDDKIQKINILHNYINKYIMDFGQLPNSENIRSMDDEVTREWWPKRFNTMQDEENPSNEILFSINSANTFVRYEGFFENDFEKNVDNIDIVNIFRNSIYISQNMIILPNLDIIFALNVKTIKFRENVINIENSNLNVYVKKLPSTNPKSCTYGEDTYMTYEPNGIGGFNIYNCKSYKWIRLKHVNLHDYKETSNLIINDTNTNLVFVDENSSHSNEILYFNKRIRIVK